MSYLVLARKYRPQNFDELQGQEHITKILKQAIEGNRIAHAFLFCGPRGIGKTSCARILAKSLNCQNGPTLKPCGSCVACQEITKGNSFDVIEIDGASNRGIDEIRTLRENVKFAPTYGRYKIYIVDEVHMLTTEAFNALLKTLEEPPAHVIFIFATTEAHKVPSTILSRCQRFDFKRISLQTISANLKAISHQEGVKIDDEALFAIAKAAGGSMRDALGILDQLSALGGQGVAAADVFSMLGMVEMEWLFALTDALVDKNCPQAMSVLNGIIEAGKDLKQLGKDLTEHFRHMMIAKIGGPQLNNLIDYPKAVKERLASQAQRISIGAILKVIELLIEAQETARVMETIRMPLELAFAKITLSQPSSAPAVPAVTMKPAAVVGLSLSAIQQQWNALTHEVSRRKMSLATYLQEASAYAFKEGQLTIGFLKEHHFAKESLEVKDNLTLVENVFSEKLGHPVRIILKIIDESLPKQAQPVVQDALEMFGGKVIKEWHNE
ncbi:MAG: DNA polymerase III subunit gamma/tau [Candidatus Omnitrophica bacterium]|nr:DNA polymerase III subunit gamma/tau [Candidatus Omnitrophota bacterium]